MRGEQLMDKRIMKIANLYGRRQQCLKCMEEMTELSVEIAKYLESGVPDGLQHVPFKLEQADVIIMVEQLKYLVNGAFVDQEIERKLERQMQRIEEGAAEKKIINKELGILDA